MTFWDVSSNLAIYFVSLICIFYAQNTGMFFLKSKMRKNYSNTDGSNAYIKSAF